jgi:glycerophosphoryl diester phosphodiesterase
MLVEKLNGRSLDDLLNELGYKPDCYSPYFPLVTKNLVDDCHQKGMKIIPWTINDKSKIQDLIEMGVDGIITDYPDLFN